MAVIALILVALLGYMYADSLVFLFDQWGSDDYSHGLFVPVISAILAWQQRHRLAGMGLTPSWWGSIVVLAGLALYVVGNLATLYLILHLSLWIVIVGLVLSFIGLKPLQKLAFPIAYLLTAIPLPVFFYNVLSGHLQLWSSALGVGVLQLIGVTAFREGNVIDLGPVQLQVAEACSGIRYLFPLTSLALLCAYFYRDRMWKRILLVLSALPISVLVNGLRIGVVGILVEWYGPQAAEGFLHLFEGWVLFLFTLTMLVAEMWALSRVQPLPGGYGFLNRFQISQGSASPESIPAAARAAPAMVLRVPAYVGSLALILPVALFSWSAGERQEVPPERTAFVDFGMRIGEWQGSPQPVEPQLISALRFDDYLLADYAASGSSPITLYMAYYRSQRKGQSAHSPQSCIPGGGWEITSHTTLNVSADGKTSPAIQINRVLIQKDRQKQLVFYWFKQRDRHLVSEYLVKFYLFWDSLMRQRSDGALIRLSAAVDPGEDEQEVEQRLLQFARGIQPQLTRYIPD
ncbi:VPLPA-CTERM-specific exosortase XrtD [Nitrospira sp. ND1]|uniref:VPLPA-CTERM-specific exosortase XrtD n=1 Tax=Nitrospira sp. ND1 TaxID=1658518 RepID=UPI001356583B|nr:VPLPA-CTERM-specific exosortase XrtD [Nitrospira sp. ND1]